MDLVYADGHLGEMAKNMRMADRVADVALGSAVAGTSYAWLGAATEFMQLVVLVTTAVASVAAAYYYAKKGREVSGNKKGPPKRSKLSGKRR